MNHYSIYLSQEWEKLELFAAVRNAGATLTGSSACGSGYYVQIDATPEQADYIDRTRYTADQDAYTPDEAWRAWKAGELTVHQMARWQERHGVYFDERGRTLC